MIAFSSRNLPKPLLKTSKLMAITTSCGSECHRLTMHGVRKYFFTQRIVKLWNSLPQDVVMATHLDGFKRGLDQFLVAKAIHGYEP